MDRGKSAYSGLVTSLKSGSILTLRFLGPDCSRSLAHSVSSFPAFLYRRV